MISEFPKEFIERINNFTKTHEKVLNPNNYDITRSALEQGYTPEFISKEIKDITEEAENIIREAGRYTRSKYDYNYSYLYGGDILMELSNSVDRALGMLYRIPFVILIENPEKKEELQTLLEDKLSKQSIQNTEPGSMGLQLCRGRLDISYRKPNPHIIKDIDVLLEEGRKSYDRLTGKHIKYTEELVMGVASDMGVAIDEVMPLLLNRVDRSDKRVQEYLSLVCDDELLRDKNNYILINDEVINDGFFDEDEDTEFRMKDFWKNYPKIRDYVLSSENISRVSPVVIKTILTIEYGSDRE